MIFKTALKLLLTAALLIVSISAATSVATAASLSWNPGGNITATSAGLLTYITTLGGIPINISCTSTMAGTLARGLIPATSGTQMGAMTRDLGSTCHNVGGQPVTQENLMPWPKTFVRRDPANTDPPTGYLYNYAIRILQNIAGVRCLWTGVRGSLFTIATGLLTWLAANNIAVTGAAIAPLNDASCLPIDVPGTGGFSFSPRQSIIQR
jgi:hypothetical protein